MKAAAVPPKRILMTADTLGGVWSYALELARGLRPFGTEIALMTMGAPLSRGQRAEVKGLANVEVFETAFRVEWMDDPWCDCDAAGERLLALEASIVPDLIHLNGYGHGALPWRSPVLVVAHSCVLSWWQAVHRHAAPAQYDTYQKRVSEGLRSAQMVVAPTRAMLAALAEHYGFSGGGCVVYNGISGQTFSSHAKEPAILAAGRAWDEAKNFALLDAVAPRLRWPIHVAGDLRHPNGSAPIYPNLNLLGLLSPEALDIEMNRASIFAHPAWYEPFGLSILEAALRGCALVLGNIPSLRELWGDAALFVTPDDQEELQSTLAMLIDSPSMLDAMSRRARQHSLRYSAAAMRDGYLAVYSELMTSNKGQEVAS